MPGRYLQTRQACIKPQGQTPQSHQTPGSNPTVKPHGHIKPQGHIKAHSQSPGSHQTPRSHQTPQSNQTPRPGQQQHNINRSRADEDRRGDLICQFSLGRGGGGLDGWLIMTSKWWEREGRRVAGVGGVASKAGRIQAV